MTQRNVVVTCEFVGCLSMVYRTSVGELVAGRTGVGSTRSPALTALNLRHAGRSNGCHEG